MAEFAVPSTNDVRDNILRVIRNGLIKLGITTPNVQPGSEFYIEAKAFANEISVAHANIQLKADDLMPDTANEEGVKRWAALVGLTQRSARGSTGYITLDTDAATTISEGEQLVDSAGLRYQVTATAIYNDGDLVPVEAVDTGYETNLATDDVLRWASTPAFCSESQPVTSPGLQNGVPDEDIETLRQRVLEQLATPAKSGNASHVTMLAEESDGRVQKAFVYPAYRGPGRWAVAVTARPSRYSKSRELTASIITNTVAPYVEGQVPENMQVDTFGCEDVDTDVSVGLSLPESVLASPPGPGGGWKDGSPWPVVDNSTVFYAYVGTVTSTTSFTVVALADRSPIAGVTRICYLSRTGTYAWTLYEATVLTSTEAPAGTYTITIDKPFVGIAANDYVFPAAERMQAYVDAALTAFENMGPGEKRAVPFGREYRRPIPSLAWPHTLNATWLNRIDSAGDEVEDTQYLYRSIATPGAPALIGDAPRILVPQRLGFYRIPS